MTASNIWIGDIKYAGKDEMPAYIEDDGMLLNIDAIETYAILHKGEKDEISED